MEEELIQNIVLEDEPIQTAPKNKIVVSYFALQMLIIQLRGDYN
ncbi:MAG: hypothetical protein H6Q18_910 [Bacteroidetes bacterium]|nr:hypothetical protein [Bacteroidota bacterium]